MESLSFRGFLQVLKRGVHLVDGVGPKDLNWIPEEPPAACIRARKVDFSSHGGGKVWRSSGKVKPE